MIMTKKKCFKCKKSFDMDCDVTIPRLACIKCGNVTPLSNKEKPMEVKKKS